MRQFFQELKRRSVYRVAVTYAVVAFVVAQVARLLQPALLLPDWFYRTVVVAALLGFPIALVLAWAFELTPEGVRRTPEAELSEEGPERAETGKGRSQHRLARRALVGLGLVAAAVGGGWYLLGGDGETIKDRSVAVLPFETIGGEQSEQLAHGVHDDLLTRLSNVSDLRVISRTSVEQFRQTEKTLPQIARELDVKWIVEGGVQQSEDLIRVNAQLIDARQDDHRWAEAYQRDLTAENLFAVQAELTKRIARSLQAQLSPSEQERVERRPTGDLQAYRLYVRGRRLLDQRSADSIREARKYFQRALRRDSSYALAWAGLADARVLHATYAHVDSVPALYEALMLAIPEAKDAARRAVKLDPDLAEARTSLAYTHLLRLEGPAALAELRRAVELKPSYSQAQDWLGGLLLSLGRPRAALKHLELAVRLNPEARNAQAWLNSAMVANGRYEEALAQARWREDPWDEARALLHLRRWKAMRTAAREALGRPGRSPLVDPWMKAYFAVADVAVGDTASARRRKAELEEGPGLASPIPIGLVHAALGDQEAAITALGRIFQKGSDLPPPHLGLIDYYELRYFYPDVFGPLRSDPRFRRLIREANRAWGLNPDGSLPDSVEASLASEAQADD